MHVGRLLPAGMALALTTALGVTHSHVGASASTLGDAGPRLRTVGYKPGLLMDEYRVGADSAVVAIHGGGWWRGSKEQMADICELVVLPTGMDCFAPDHTLSTDGSYPAANADVRDAVAYVRSLGYEEVGALGVSAGGTLGCSTRKTKG